MRDKITAFVNQNNLITENDTVLIAFSGGADSVFLAEYLLSIKDEYSLYLKIAHIEHGIRGAESIADCEFSRAYAKKNNIEFYELHINAPEEAKKLHMGVEEYSRKRRYEFFETIDCDKIASAHNLTDNVETMLFRIARGSSIKGLCAIPVRRNNIIRPLLCISGDEIRNHLNTNNISYCIDSTNADNNYSRNYIRNVIIPEFRNINSEFTENAARLINSICETEETVSLFTEALYKTICKDNKLLITDLKFQPKAVIKRIIYKYFEENGIKLDSLHLGNVYKLLDKKGKIQLKGNTFAFSDGEFLRIGRYNVFSFDELVIKKQIVCLDSENNFLNNCELSFKKFDFCCDYDKIIGNVFVRQRIDGDKISPTGRGCTKTLKKLFNEYHIPVENRNNVPVICDDCGVIGVYGYCTDERVRIDALSKNVLIIDIRRDTEDKF